MESGAGARREVVHCAERNHAKPTIATIALLSRAGTHRTIAKATFRSPLTRVPSCADGASAQEPPSRVYIGK